MATNDLSPALGAGDLSLGRGARSLPLAREAGDLSPSPAGVAGAPAGRPVEGSSAGRPVESASRPIGRAAVSGPATFEASVRPHYDALVRRLVLVLGDRRAAEDIAQDTYLAAFRSWDRFDGGNVRSWLYTIGLRLAFNERRRHRRWLDAIRRLEPRPWRDPVDPDLWAALGRLDARVRGALLLNVIDGYTQREIGSILGVPEGTVASWLSRARATLRADLAVRT